MPLAIYPYMCRFVAGLFVLFHLSVCFYASTKLSYLLLLNYVFFFLFKFSLLDDTTQITPCQLFFKIFIYLFIWLCRVLVVACGLLSCGMRTLTCGMPVGSSSLTRDGTCAPCSGIMEC